MCFKEKAAENIGLTSLLFLCATLTLKSQLPLILSRAFKCQRVCMSPGFYSCSHCDISVLLSHNLHALNCLKSAPWSRPRKKHLKWVVTTLLMYLLCLEQIFFFPPEHVISWWSQRLMFCGDLFQCSLSVSGNFLDMCLWCYNYLRCWENIRIWKEMEEETNFACSFILHLEII